VVVCFELPSDPLARSTLWSQPIQVNCPNCAGQHEMDYREAYVTGVMSEFKCIPADVRRARIH
jgi:hypothetical protein